MIVVGGAAVVGGVAVVGGAVVAGEAVDVAGETTVVVELQDAASNAVATSIRSTRRCMVITSETPSGPYWFQGLSITFGVAGRTLNLL